MSSVLDGKLQTAVNDSLASSRPNVEGQQLRLMQDVMDNGNVIDGKLYQDWTRTGGPIDQMIQSPDAGTHAAGIKFRHAIDDELETANQSNPAVLEQLKTARAQWKALQTVKPLSLQRDTSGGAPSVGEINPQNLQTAVGNNYSNAGTAAPGDIPLLDAARFAQRFMKPQSAVLGHGVGGGVTALLAERAVEDPSMFLDPKRLAMYGGGAAGLAALGRAMRMQTPANRLLAGVQNPGGFQVGAPAWQAMLGANRMMPSMTPMVGQ
jgi:hypothetical protein